MINIDQCIRLISLTVFVLWEYTTRNNASVRKHYNAKAEYYGIKSKIPAEWFPVIWLVLKALIIASSFLYMEYTININNWAYIVFFSLFYANIILAKFWMPLFFDMHRHNEAGVVAFLLFATAYAIFGVMFCRENVGDDGLLPAFLWLPYPLWLTVALFINVRWAMEANRKHAQGGHHYGSEEYHAHHQRSHHNKKDAEVMNVIRQSEKPEREIGFTQTRNPPPQRGILLRTPLL